MPQDGRWHGNNRYVGLHFDLHANASDPDLGTKSTVDHLVAMLRRADVDFVQTDCKGHPGYTCWPSAIPAASVPSDLPVDLLQRWRKATRKLGLPLHCHYSGIVDAAAAKAHRRWRVVRPEGAEGFGPVAQTLGPGHERCMCPRSPYLAQLMIPQMLEAIDRYGVDGFWIDGDLWAVYPCYCKRCQTAFARESDWDAAPLTSSDPGWQDWLDFTQRSFEAYVDAYCRAVHEHAENVLVCSNWTQTFKHPGQPQAQTDWISGDNTWVFSLDPCRCESRFISTRGKHWDIMIWTFFRSTQSFDPDYTWELKPVEMLQQEAAVVLALGGAVQFYCHAPSLRDGRLVPWHIERLREVVRFCKKRRRYCQNTETISQVAVLHSEEHVKAHRGVNLMWDVDTQPVEGACFSLLENHYGVDILDEWALRSRCSDFPVIVVPEQTDLSPAMIQELKDYVRGGGRLLVSGAGALDRFGEDFLGVQGQEQERDACYFVPAADGKAHVLSERWALCKTKTAKAITRLSQSPVLSALELPYAAAYLNRVGKGQVLFAPFDLFRFYGRTRQSMVGAFVGSLMKALSGNLLNQVKAPRCVDVVYRRKGKCTIVHFINRASGVPGRPNDGTVAEIAPVGPVRLRMRCTEPSSVSLAFESGDMEWSWKGGVLTATVAQVGLHAALVIRR